MTSLVSIYNTFKPNNNNDKEKETLNSIIKGTKSVLASKLKFKQYIQSYSKKTERSSFKSPGISDYPIFRKQSSLLIPVKIRKINFYEDLNIKSEKNDDDFMVKKKKLFLISPSPRDSSYKHKFLKTIKTSRELFKNKLFGLYSKKTNKKERYNSLFLDFFYKWTNDSKNNSKIDYSDNNKNIEEIKNDKYSELKYDDNIIFNQDYSKFIKEKIDYIKNNNIENNQVKIENSFNDVNGKEIHLKLESIKIIFKPIRNKINKNLIKSYNAKNDKKEKENKEIILYIPLYYAFLIYYKKLELFKKILVSSIVFNNNFDTIEFNDKLISSTIKDFINNNISNNNSPIINKRKETNYDSKKNIKPTNSNLSLSFKKNQPFRKLATKNYMNYPTSSGDKKSNNTSTFNMLRNSFLDKSTNINKKKEAIFHSNKNRNRNTICDINYLSGKNSFGDKDNYDEEKNNNENININAHNFNEYIFLWETSSKTFLVTILMPTIYFKYKDLKNEIIAFSDKNLYLYMYKNNFINWDFYALNFLFSIKAFRKIILNNYSLVKKKILKDIIFSKTLNNEKPVNSMNNFLIFRNKTRKNNLKEQNKNNLYIENKLNEFSNEPIIINKNRNKIYNTLNENNESYLFFYTDHLYNNSIIKLYSYLIVIDYERLNPKIKWKYYLDFKQMKQLNEISKYESLDTFLPKIIKTDFQNGLLSMDFSLFDEFDIDILVYEKRNIMNESKVKNKTINVNNMANNNISNKELCIDIQYPFVKIIKSNYNSLNNTIFFSMNKVDLDIDFLQIINNYNIDSWSQKILGIINASKGGLNGNLYLSPVINSGNIPKNKTIKITPFSNPVDKNIGNSYKKFVKSITFNGIPAISKFH